MHQGIEANDTEAEHLIIGRLKENGLFRIAESGVRVLHKTTYLKGSVPNLIQKQLAGEIAGDAEGIRDVVNLLRVERVLFMNDEVLKKRIRRALNKNPRIDSSKLSVQVKKGAVHLDGPVGSATEKFLTGREIWAIPGVREIVNNIAVTAAAPRSEVQVIGEMLEGLSTCLGLDLSKVSVEFSSGIARLRGAVPGEYLKKAAGELAAWTPSVTSVINELEVLEQAGSRQLTFPGPANVKPA